MSRVSAALVLIGGWLVLFPAAGKSQGNTGIIPPDRATLWNPGVSGGIPNRTTICRTVNAATYGNGSQDASAGIQSAIDACPVGQVVKLSAGEFRINSRLRIDKGIVLRGAGPTLTTLRKGNTTDEEIVLMGVLWPKIERSVNLTSNAAKGSSSVTVANTSGLAAGEIVLIDEVTDPSITRWNPKSPPGNASRGWFSRMDRPVGQIMEVQSVSGNTVTFTTPLHIGFDTAHNAQLSRFVAYTGGPIVPAVKNAGLEDLKVYGGRNDNISMSLAAYSWVKNVESEYSLGDSIGLDMTFRCTVRDSYFHHSPEKYPGGGAYGLSFAMASADNLIENNIFWNFNKVMVMRASGGGNVIGYNYFEDGYIGNPGDLNNLQWVETGLNGSHMTTPHFELFEGNQSFNIDGDNTWGNSVYMTFLRNHVTTKRRSLGGLQLLDRQNARGVGLMEGHWWYTFVGNVIGTATMNPIPHLGYEYEDTFPWGDGLVFIWRLGYNPENWNAPADPKVLSTVIRDGNYDYFTKQVRWDRPAQAIPNSLYLSGKPAFFGSCTWPWVNATGTTKLYTLPARARFDGNPNACGSSSNPSTPAAPTNVRIIPG